MGYKDKSKNLCQDINIRGGGYIGYIYVGYDIHICKKTFLELMVFGTLSRVKVDDGLGEETIELDKENYANFGKVNLSVGLRFVL